MTHETDQFLLGVNRRALLSTLAVLPAPSTTLFSTSAQAQISPSGDGLPSWNEGPAKQAILDFVPEVLDSHVVFKSMGERMGVEVQ